MLSSKTDPNSSKLTILLICCLIFILMLYCNRCTDLVADDYRYCFSFADDTRIDSISDIFPSMRAHRSSMNGRVIAHFLVQLFLMLPKTVFNIFNSAVFCLLILLIYQTAVFNREHNALLLASIFGCIWVLQPEFGQVFLWLDGSVNYLWCALLCFIYLKVFIGFFEDRAEPDTALRVLFVIFSFAVGAFSENSSVAIIFMSILLIALDRLCYKRNAPVWIYISLAAATAGFIYMMAAPAETVNKSAEFSLPVLIGNFVETGLFYLRFWPLLISYILLICLYMKRKLDSKRLLLSLCYFLGSLAGQFVLVFAMYCAGRSTYIALLLLIEANAMLFVPLFEGKTGRILSVLCSICLAVTLYYCVKGVNDIRRTHYLLSYNNELIMQCVSSGGSDLQIPRPYAKTKYSAIEGLAYLNTEDSTDWPNRYMAKYFGAESITGY